MQACRNCLKFSGEKLQHAAHAGLVLRRFLQFAVQDEAKRHPVARTELYATARSSTSNARVVYEMAFRRWSDSTPKTTSERLDVQGRLIVGLGGDNVLETGITLHHTYGVPIIPGSAMKGLAAHYCDQVWGRADQNFKKLGDYHKILFGTTGDSGHINFHDAWITPDSLQTDGKSGLALDVMTPHHSDYYSDKTYQAGENQGKLIPPTDFDDPTPITFLSVTGAFHIAVSCDVTGDPGERWAKLAFDLLKEALREWGVGGKTSSGYGRLDSSIVSSKVTPVTSHRPASGSLTTKRACGTPVHVTILEARQKGGFKVQESGKPPGTLTLGPCPSPSPEPNDVVNVLVHVDDPATPQYKWPDPNAKLHRLTTPKKGNRK